MFGNPGLKAYFYLIYVFIRTHCKSPYLSISNILYNFAHEERLANIPLNMGVRA